MVQNGRMWTACGRDRDREHESEQGQDMIGHGANLVDELLAHGQTKVGNSADLPRFGQLVANRGPTIVKLWSTHGQTMVPTWSMHGPNTVGTECKHGRGIVETRPDLRHMVGTCTSTRPTHGLNMAEPWTQHGRPMIET